MAIEPTTNTAQTANRGERRNNLTAVGYMLIAVVGFSSIPLLIAGGNGSENPFLFSGALRFGLGVGHLLFLLGFYWSLFRQPEVLSLIWRRIFTWAMLFIVINQFEYALFAWSIRFIDISVTVILFETWPIFLILLTARLFRSEQRYRRTTRAMALMLIISFAGFALVTISQVEEFGEFGGIVLSDTLVGLGLVLAAVIVATLSAFGFRWGADLSRALSDAAIGARNRDSVDLFCVLFASLIGNFVGSGLSAIAGIVVGESMTSGSLTVAVVGGIFAFALANIFWRSAVLLTNNLGVNALAYAIPIFSLIWLFLFSQVNVARVDFLVIGATTIITTNLLINFEAEIRWGFKALILALGTCGAVVYLRDGMFESLGVDKWHWTAGGYFESITLAATVFTLLLAFRVARLVSRTSEEDNRTFAIYRKLDMLARRGVINSQVCRYILDIDQARNNSAMEKESYTQARRLIAEVDPRPLNEADSQLLSDAEAQLDALARSKQVDIHLGEQFALYIFGGITIGLAILTLPSQVAGWTRLLVDLFAILISAVIIFLLFHIQDLQRERDDSKLEPAAPATDYRHHLARFLDTQQRSFDQWLSIVVGAAIVLTYAALLAHKWLGWFG